MSDFLLSIVTPAYNRAAHLTKCFESLLRQSDQAFEWIVIDDGSTDNTSQVCELLRHANKINMTCVRKENGGKHTALNAAHQYIRGKYILILDSDDTLTEDAVEQIHKMWHLYENMKEVGMLIWLKGASKNDPNCVAKTEWKIADYRNHGRTVFHSRDCCEVIRTELFLKYPFPLFENEKFISEGALWNRAAAEAKCVYFNKVIYLCEYLEGGLTKSGKNLRIRNPRGGMYTSFLRMKSGQRINEQIKGSILYACYGFFSGMSISEILTCDKGNPLKKILGIIPGYALYRVWKKQYGD